ncbi:DUF2785 domain-containing protein [Nocardia nova]|uniref:DUF2785 domain-containing protein n=1 Tax=Nocardia nova TaxID=37330 RepID=UPI0033C0BD36
MGNGDTVIGGIDWQAVAAGDWAVPAGADPARLVDVLVEMLAAPDPQVRDGFGYTAVSVWGRRGVLDSELEHLGDVMADRLAGHPQVQARTFAALVFGVVLGRGAELPRGTVERWYETFENWYRTEREVRGYDETLGWLHAVAHGADAAAAFARAVPRHAPDILELCAHRMTAKDTDYRYSQLEDARLARAVTAVLHTPGLTRDQALGWFDVVDDAFAGAGPGPCPPWAANTFATLQSLHLHLMLGLRAGGVPAHGDEVAEHAAAIMRLPFPWLG